MLNKYFKYEHIHFNPLSHFIAWSWLCEFTRFFANWLHELAFGEAIEYVKIGQESWS